MSDSEREYQAPVERLIEAIAEQIGPWSLEDRILQWREQAQIQDGGGGYVDGRAAAFERCADEAELILKQRKTPNGGPA